MHAMPILPGLSPVEAKSLTATFDAGRLSSDGGLVARVEATGVGTDVRFIVTSLEGRGKTLYEKVFCARGRAENLIKDLKRFTRSDKTACARWQANQFRLFLHLGAYWLLHTLRNAAPKGSRWRGATFETIRRTFVKVTAKSDAFKLLCVPDNLHEADAIDDLDIRFDGAEPDLSVAQDLHRDGL